MRRRNNSSREPIRLVGRPLRMQNHIIDDADGPETGRPVGARDAAPRLALGHRSGAQATCRPWLSFQDPAAHLTSSVPFAAKSARQGYVRDPGLPARINAGPRSTSLEPHRDVGFVRKPPPSTNPRCTCTSRTRCLSNPHLKLWSAALGRRTQPRRIASRAPDLSRSRIKIITPEPTRPSATSQL